MKEYLSDEETRQIAQLFVDLCDAPAGEKMAILAKFDAYDHDKFFAPTKSTIADFDADLNVRWMYRSRVVNWLNGGDDVGIEQIIRSVHILALAAMLATEDEYYVDERLHVDKYTQLQHLLEHRDVEEWAVLQKLGYGSCSMSGCETAWVYAGDVTRYSRQLKAAGWEPVVRKDDKFIVNMATETAIRVRNATARYCCDSHKTQASENPTGIVLKQPISGPTRARYNKDLIQKDAPLTGKKLTV